MSVNSGVKSTAYRTSGMVTYNGFSACCWVYLRDRAYRLPVGMAEAVGGTSYNRWSIETDGKCRVAHSTSGASGTTTVPLSTWVHIGWKRIANDLSIYLNGTLEATVSSAPTFTKSTDRICGEYDTNVPDHSFAAAKMWNADLDAAGFEDEMYGYTAARTADLHTVSRFLTHTDTANEVSGGVGWTNYNLTTNTDPPAFLSGGGGSAAALLRRRRIISLGAR